MKHHARRRGLGLVYLVCTGRRSGGVVPVRAHFGVFGWLLGALGLGGGQSARWGWGPLDGMCCCPLGRLSGLELLLGWWFVVVVAGGGGLCP